MRLQTDMRFLALALILALVSCSKGPGGSGASSAVTQEPGEDPAPVLIVLGDPGSLSRSLEEIGDSFSSGPVKVIDEEGNTLMQLSRESFPRGVESGGGTSIVAKTVKGESIYIDAVSKKQILNPKVFYASHFADGLAVAKENENAPNCGYADEQGEMKVAPVYSRCQPFSDGVARVAKRLPSGEPFISGDVTRWGMIDASGREVVPFAAKEVNPIGGGRYVFTEKISSIYDAKQKRLIPVPGLKDSVSTNSSAALMDGEVEGRSVRFYVQAGKEPVIVPNDTSILGANFVKYSEQEGAFQFSTPDGRKLGAAKWDGLPFERIGYGKTLFVSREGRLGLMGEEGKWILPAEDERFRPFVNGWAAVMKSGVWRMINLSGETLFELPSEPVWIAGRFVQTIVAGPGSVETGVWNRAGKNVAGLVLKR